jgi:RNA recognition motif-containing protein
MAAASGAQGGMHGQGGYQQPMHQSTKAPSSAQDGDESIQTRKLFLGGLPGPTSEEELMGIFSNFGPFLEPFFGYKLYKTLDRSSDILCKALQAS